MRDSLRLVIVGLILLWMAALSGCDVAGTTQEDMLKHAFRRPSDDEDDTPAIAAPATAARQPPAVTARTPVESPAQRRPATIVTEKPTAGSDPPLAAGVEAVAAPAEAFGPPPTAPTTPDGRLQLSQQNLTRIGVALNRYVAERGAFPTPAIYDSRKRPLLSWRVALLPYLGHTELYYQFDRDAPWDSDHNRQLLRRIPPVYQSPERWDAMTNYQLLTGRTTLFPGVRPVAPRRVEDGRENTMAIVEVDDVSAVPWTQPADYPVRIPGPLSHLGGLRDGVFLSVFADGEVLAVPSTAPQRLLWAAFSFEGGESFATDELLSVEQVPPAVAATPAGDRSPDPLPTRGSLASLPKTRQAASSAFPQQPVPGKDAQRRATELIKDLFKEKFDQANRNAKSGVAQEMLDTAETVNDVAERYMLLEIAKDVAVFSGDVGLTIEITDKLQEMFDVDRFDLLAETATKLGRTMKGSGAETFSRWAAKHARQALKAERYKEGGQLVSAAVVRAYQSSNHDLKEEMRELRETVDYERELRQAADQAIEVLEENPEDGVAHTKLGKYLCFVKEDWENGLPILANCTAPVLKQLAELELGNPQQAGDQLAVADTWWDYSEKQEGAEQRAMVKRAVHWYRNSLDRLPAGLLTIRAERRISEYEKDYRQEDEAGGR